MATKCSIWRALLVNVIHELLNEHPEVEFFDELDEFIDESLFSYEFDESSNYMSYAHYEISLEQLIS